VDEEGKGRRIGCPGVGLRVSYSAATLGNLNFWRFVRPDEYQEALSEAFEILTSNGGKLFNVTESYVKG
jgi:hypothetical protein